MLNLWVLPFPSLLVQSSTAQSSAGRDTEPNQEEKGKHLSTSDGGTASNYIGSAEVTKTKAKKNIMDVNVMELAIPPLGSLDMRSKGGWPAGDVAAVQGGVVS
ncbi:unnamed protein product [Calypogeia fissa]